MARRGDLMTMLAAEALLLGGMAAYIEGHVALAGVCIGTLVGALVLNFAAEGQGAPPRALASTSSAS